MQADELPPQLAPSYQSFSQMFVRLLQQQSRAFTYQVYDVTRGQYPKQQHNYDALLVTGSKADSFGTDDWIVCLRSYLAERYAAGDALIGVCFGHQILALVLGGEVARAAQGWGVGVHNYQLKAAPVANIVNMPQQLAMLVSHRDQVISLPLGAELVASSEFCPNAAFSMDGRVLCFQGHPEFTNDFSRSLLQLRRSIYTQELYYQSLQSLEQSHDGLLVGGWMADFIEQARNRRS